MNDDERAIRELISKWYRATTQGDTETVLSLMAEDVFFMVPGAEPFGKDAFRSASAAQQGIQIDGSSEILEIEVFGPWAWVRTRIEVTMTLPDGKATNRAGYTLTIFRKKPNGSWLLFRDANLLSS